MKKYQVYLISHILAIFVGILIGYILFNPYKEYVEKIKKVSITIPPHTEYVKIIEKDTITEKKLLNKIALLEFQLQKAKEALKQSSSNIDTIFKWQKYEYSDKYLKFWINYFGLLKDFEYTILKRDTFVLTKEIYQVKYKRDWKNYLIASGIGFIIGYYLTHK